MKQQQGKRQSLTASAAPARPPGLLAHVAAKQAKRAERQRLRDDRRVSRA